MCVRVHPCVVCAGGWEGMCVRKRETSHWLMGPEEEQRDAFLTPTGKETSKVCRHGSPSPIMEQLPDVEKPVRMDSQPKPLKLYFRYNNTGLENHQNILQSMHEVYRSIQMCVYKKVISPYFLHHFCPATPVSLLVCCNSLEIRLCFCLPTAYFQYKSQTCPLKIQIGSHCFFP